MVGREWDFSRVRVDQSWIFQGFDGGQSEGRMAAIFSAPQI